METKICSKCGIEKEITEFIKRPNSDKYYGTCKQCKNEYAKKYRIEKAEQISKQRKQYYRDNIEIMKERSHKYINEHKDEIKERQKKYYEKNSKVLNEKSRNYYREHIDEIKEQKKIYNKENENYQKQWRKAYYEKNAKKIGEYQIEYRKNHSEEIAEYNKKYRKENKEILKEKQRIYNQEHIEQRREHDRKYRKNNVDKLRIYRESYRKQKIESDPLFKLTVNIRHLISNSLRKQGYTKKTRTYKILGCDYDEFNQYLLQTYKNNYGEDWDGKEDIHIDHIIPLASAKSEEDVIRLCHYTNLQLLKAKDNLNKKDKLDWNLKN